MNCSFCGTQLPVGAVNCPRCGAAADYYAPAESGYNDPTVVSSSEPLAQQPPPTMYGSPSYAVAAATPSDTPSYGSALQDPYASSLYQSPHDPYSIAAPPPPSPQRSGKHSGIIVAVVILVLLLVGGGMLALLGYAAARKATIATTIVTAQNFTANGTFTRLSRTITHVRQDGTDTAYSITQQEVDYGDVTGSYTTVLASIVHADKTSTFTGSSTCTCTVAGKSGTLLWSFTGTSTASDSFQGQVFDYHGTGDLAKLHGQGVFQGQGVNGTYSVQFHFDS